MVLFGSVLWETGYINTKQPTEQVEMQIPQNEWIYSLLSETENYGLRQFGGFTYNGNNQQLPQINSTVNDILPRQIWQHVVWYNKWPLPEEQIDGSLEYISTDNGLQ